MSSFHDTIIKFHKLIYCCYYYWTLGPLWSTRQILWGSGMAATQHLTLHTDMTLWNSHTYLPGWADLLVSNTAPVSSTWWQSIPHSDWIPRHLLWDQWPYPATVNCGGEKKKKPPLPCNLLVVVIMLILLQPLHRSCGRIGPPAEDFHDVNQLLSFSREKQPCQLTSCRQVWSSEIYSNHNAPKYRGKWIFKTRGGGKNSWNGWKCQDTENICSSEFRSSHQELLSFIFSTQHQKSLRQKFRKLSGNFSRPPWFQWGQMSLRVAPEYSLRWRQVRREIKQKKGLEGKGRTQRDWGGGKGVSAILS